MIDQYAILILDDSDNATKKCVESQNRRCKKLRTTVVNLSKNYHIKGNELQKLTLNSKLIIISHGSMHGPYSIKYGRLNALEMFNLLCELGLVCVGLISFKGCLIGAGYYLDQLKDVMNSRNAIYCQYLLAYKGKSETVGKHEIIGAGDDLLRSLTFNMCKLPDSYRVRIVTGNVPAIEPFKNTKRWRRMFSHS